VLSDVPADFVVRPAVAVQPILNFTLLTSCVLTERTDPNIDTVHVWILSIRVKQRDLLKDSLVIFAGEFGRTPHGSGGRGHNNRGHTTWMAGGGVKGGFNYGSTDELGAEASEDRMHTHDWHATILHLLGLDHEKLTYQYAGRPFRLTNVGGKVAEGILA
jgi:hypothetical protein